MNWIYVVVWVLIGLVVGLFITAIVGIFLYMGDCHDRGGHLVGDGTYTTTYIHSGNVLIPVTNENVVCSK